MKLIKCHIENFGKLNNQDFAFNQGLTSLCFGNGYGKSTLVAFIKAMLYGMKSVRKGGRELEEREKYFPFGGGAFGGNITVLHNGREYRIERFFDVKSDTKDTLAVYLNGAKTDELGGEIGMALLGLDAESFERAMLMNSTDAAYGAGVGISERLWGFDADGGESFEAAYAALDARKRQIKAARGHNDELSRIDDTIADLHRRINSAELTAARLESLYAERSAILAQIADLEEKKQHADTMNLLDEKRKAYAYRLIKVQEKRDELASLSAKYPNGELSKEAENELRLALSELQQSLGERSGVSMSDKRAERLSALSLKFKDRAKAESDISLLDALSAKCAELKAMSEGASQGLQPAESPDGAIPTQDKSKAQKKAPAPFVLLTVGAMLTALAAVCTFGISKIISLLLLFSGFCMLTAAFLFKSKSAADASISGESEPTAQPPNTQSADAQRFESARAIIIRKANELAGAYNYPEIGTDAELREVRMLMERELHEQAALLEERGELRTRQAEIAAKIANTEKRLRALLAAFSPSMAESALSAEQIRAATDKAVLDRSLMARCRSDLAELVCSADDYRREAGLDTMSESEAQSLAAGAPRIGEAQANESFAALPEKRSEAARLEREIRAIESELELTPDYRRALASEEEKREETRHKLKMLEATMSALSEAEHNLSQKYIAPIKERFVGYASKIESAIGERYTIDKKLNIRFDEGGASRDERHLSQGQHAVVSLALRLSLIDEMFGKDAFVILDDPFAPLDDSNFTKMKKLIESASKTRQIVYFTCHNSRKI